MPVYRVNYMKRGYLRFLSHKDWMRCVFKALLRSPLPIVFSEGFNPHLKVTFGLPLNVGVVGEDEYLDITLHDTIDAEKCFTALAQVMPEHIRIKQCEILNACSQKLSQKMSTVRYVADITPWVQDIAACEYMVSAFMKAQEIYIEKKRQDDIKKVNIRPFIEEMQVITTGHGQVHCIFREQVQQSGYPNPYEVIAAVFGISMDRAKTVLVVRTRA